MLPGREMFSERLHLWTCSASQEVHRWAALQATAKAAWNAVPGNESRIRGRWAKKGAGWVALAGRMATISYLPEEYRSLVSRIPKFSKFRKFRGSHLFEE